MRFERNKGLRVMCGALALGACCAAASGDEVTDRSKDPNLWAAPGGDPSLTRHSSLNSINTSNVAKLQMVSIGDDVDRNADSAGHHQLVAGAVNGFNQPATEFFGVFKIKRE